MKRILMYGKNGRPAGTTPSIILINPKYAHNVGAAVRAASCFGIEQVWFTGDRVAIELEAIKRLPREERMRGYADVQLINFDYPFDAFPRHAVPVAIELREHSERLPEFVHPEDAVYVLGPEDGALDKSILRHCHRFVCIPSRHCLNLAASVYVVLYDRAVKMWHDGVPLPELSERRGFACDLERESY